MAGRANCARRLDSQQPHLQFRVPSAPQTAVLTLLGCPTVKQSAQCAGGPQAVDADVEDNAVSAMDPKPAVFPRLLAVRAERLALKVARVFQPMNTPVPLLRDVFALGSHRHHVLLSLRHT